MTSVNISSVIESQFPDFYHDSSENLIAFMRAYYEWLEQEQDVILSSNLTDLRDIDSTVDGFLKYFKSKYLANITTTIAADLKTVIKNSHTFYATKGTNKSVELLMRILYDVDAEVYYPSQDILKPSDGNWYRPVYIELSPTTTVNSLIGKQIYGVQSGATALVESVTRKMSNGGYYDVAYISQTVGNFTYGEQITDRTGNLTDAPIVIGSLNQIQIVNGGQDYAIGDVVELLSDTGRKAKARVTSIENGTGRVQFTLVDGGTGYTLNALTLVSNSVLTMNPVRNANGSISGFFDFETVEQILANVEFISSNGTFSNGSVVKGYTSGTLIEQANGIILETAQTGANGSFNVFTLSGDFRFADRVKNVAGTIDALIDTATDITAVANVVGSNTTHIGITDITNSFYVSNDDIVYIKGRTSNTYANVIAKSIGSGATFQIGSLTDEETFFVNLDFFSGNNVTNIPFGQIRLDGRGSGACNVNVITVGNRLAITGLAGSISANDFVYQANSTATVANGLVYLANSTVVSVYPISGTFNTSNTLIGPSGNATVSSITILGGSGYANGDPLVFTNGGQTVTNVVITAGGTSYKNGEHIVVTGDGSNAAISISTNSSGGITSVNIIDGGYGYTSIPTLTVNTGTGSGATLVARLNNLTGSAVATVNTYANGMMQSINVTNHGTDYFNDPDYTITTSGTGANTHLFMNYGYGFVKYPSGNSSTVLNSLLTTEFVTAGTVASIGNITPGSNYNLAPFVKVIEPLIAGYDKRDVILAVSNVQGGYVTGEVVTQTTNATANVLTFTGISGNSAFEIGELLTQSNATTTGVVFATNTTSVSVYSITGTFVVTANVASKITGTTTNATANVTATAAGVKQSQAAGRVLSSNSTTVVVRQQTFNSDFISSGSDKLIGFTSAANAQINTITRDPDSFAMGLNANVTANVHTANGIVSELEVIDSGFGYLQDEPIELRAIEGNNEFLISGRTILEHQGQGEGFWKSTAGFLNSDKYIHDGEYYQAYAYEVRAGISLDYYSTIVKRLLHVAGTKMFGRTIIKSLDTFEPVGTTTVSQS